MEKKRGTVGAIVDRFFARQLGLPPEISSWKVSGISIPVQDGTAQFKLVGDLYQPLFTDDTKPKGTILVRSPYGRHIAYALTNARFHAARGYNCLLVSSRGTFGSGGSFEPWRNEEKDGHVVVEWMRKQDWYTGTFATQGSSYLGFVQWSILKEPPPDMVAAVIQCAPHDFSRQLWGTGSLALEWYVWGERLLHQEEIGILEAFKAINTLKRMKSVLNAQPLTDSLKTHFKGRAPWLDFVVDHPDISDAFYHEMQCGEALERANIPILLVTGWQDLFVRQTIEQYVRLHERNTHVVLLIGPWTHMQIGLDAKTHETAFNWLEEHLARQKNHARKPGVHYFVTGAKDWRDTTRWPPPTTGETLYLHKDNKLSPNGPSAEEGSSNFTFEYKQPTPTIGGNLLLGGGNLDDTLLASRSDVLVFTTDPLERDLEITGGIIVELMHTCNAAEVDLSVRVSEVNAKGYSRLVTESYRHLDSGGQVKKVILRLDECAHRFMKGHRIRLYLAGASHPRYACVLRDAIHTIFHKSTEASKIVMPVAIS
ncbi:hydrolase [Stagonosporopsis vannaccii]|nr:hydrolase [Stagonosporopsis vannaccii]